MGATPSRFHKERAHIPDEILAECMTGFSIGQLHIVAAVNLQLRQVVKDILSHRVHRNLSKFIKENEMDSFLDLLKACGAVVGGSVAQGVITPEIFKADEPTDLNLFVRRRNADVFAKTLSEQHRYRIEGFMSGDDTTPVESTVYLHHEEHHAKIIISESTTSTCTRPILQSMFTHQVNFFNADHIYCMYPHLTPKLKTMECVFRPRQRALNALQEEQRELVHQRELLISRGLDLIGEEDEKDLCRAATACRSYNRDLLLHRRGVKKWPIEDIGIMCWGKDSNPENILHRNPDLFTIGGECKDRACVTAVVR